MQRRLSDFGHWSSAHARYAAYAPFLLFALIGLADYAGSLASGLATDSDTTITLSRALAGLDPSIYRQDFLFDAPGNYSFYNNTSVAFFQLMDWLGIESPDYPYRGFRVLGAITTFAFLSGYYLLGLRLTQSRLISLAFAFAAAIAVTTFPGDYWGLYREPQARVLFGTLLPFLLLMALDAGVNLARWIAVFVVAGIGVWIHPASGPTVALALMLAMLAANYDGPSSIGPLLKTAVISGVIFLLIAVPNILQYIDGVRHAAEGIDAAAVDEAIRLRYRGEYVDPLAGLASAFAQTFAGPRVLLLLLSAAGLIIVARTSSLNERPAWVLVAAFLAALMIIACGIPVLENTIARANGGNSQQLDLVRGVRYVVPILLLFAFWGASKLPVAPMLQAAAALSIMAFWFLAKDVPPVHRQNMKPALGLQCWLKGQLRCNPPRIAAERELLAYLQNNTPADARFFSPSYGLTIRAVARRPLAFDWKDTGWLAYSNQAKLVANIASIRKVLEIRDEKDPAREAQQWLALGRDVGAQYVVLTPKDGKPAADIDPVVFSNAAGTVFQIK